MVEIGRLVPTRRIPTVLTVAEVGSLLGLMEVVTALLARLLYGTRMHSAEGLSMRVPEQQVAALAAVTNGLFRTSLRA